jgi:hypothetical protein
MTELSTARLRGKLRFDKGGDEARHRGGEIA